MLWKILNSVNSRFIGYDRRVRFRDLARIPPNGRQPTTTAVNFYSAVNNIGNYLPVLGIRTILGCEPDTWNMHDREIDFDFINRHYRCAIIGGGGLLDKGFEPFWERFSRECKVPTVIWGVGICASDSASQKGVDRQVFARAADKCALINFRDDLTAEHYNVPNAIITACPTIVYVNTLARYRPSSPSRVLYSSHEELVSEQERHLIGRQLRRTLGRVNFTDNIQRRLTGVDDIIRRLYLTSRLVVTTRLHGAVIAYGLGIPYIALPRDEKIRAFHRLYGNGISIDDCTLLPDALATRIPCGNPVQYEPIHDFGTQVRSWLSSLV